MRVDGLAGTLAVLVDEAEWAARTPVVADMASSHAGTGRELFAMFRANVGPADRGAAVF